MPLTNAQYDILERRYADIRLANRHELEERRAYVNSHIDGYKELTDAIVNLSMEKARLAVAGEAVSYEDLSRTIDDLISQKRALLAGAGLGEDYLDPIYNCPDCKDTGYIDGSKCHCLRQASVSLLYSNSNIEDYLMGADFSNFSADYYKGNDLENFKDSLDKAQKFVENFDAEHGNMLFYGTVGTGKSMMSTCIARNLIDSGHSVIYFSAAGLMDALSKYTFDYKAKETSTIHSDITDCDLLIIDDLGTEMTNNFTITSLFSCMNDRALSHKSTIISTNLSLEDLRERYSDRIFSRITGGYTLARLTGPDIRLISKLNQQ